MNRKDFELIARALKGAKPKINPADDDWSGDCAREQAWRNCCGAIAISIPGDAKYKFLKACGCS